MQRRILPLLLVGMFVSAIIAIAAAGLLLSQNHGNSASGSTTPKTAKRWQSGEILAVSPLEPNDTDGDGLFNTLDVTVTATTTNAGNYELIATLVDADGNFLTTAAFNSRTEDRPLAIGEHAIMLSFDGQLIHNLGKDGPYRLERVVLNDQRSGSVEIDRAEQADPSLPYTAREFQAPNIQITHVADTLHDLDMNGTFDTVAISVELELIQPGAYRWHALIVDTHGTEVARLHGLEELEKQAQIVLEIDGRALALDEQDGPYVLSEFTIGRTDNPDIQLTKIELHTTAAYAAKDFERPLLPVVQFGQATARATREADVVAMDIVFDPVPTVEGTVEFYTVDGTAISGRDYRGGESEVTFPAGKASMRLAINLFPYDEGGTGGTFTIGIRSPSHASLGEQTTMEVTVAGR